VSTNSPPPFGGAPPQQMIVSCPHCKTALSLTVSQAGSVVSCANCGGRFQTPLPTARPPMPQSLAGGVDPLEYQNFVGKKIAAGICGIFLGSFGVHKFILGLNSGGTVMLTIWLLSFVTGVCVILPLFGAFAIQIIGVIEGIIYLTKSDEDFYQSYAVQKKNWF